MKALENYEVIMNEFDDIGEGAEGVEIPDVDVSGGGKNPLKGVLTALIVVLVLAFQALGSHFIVKMLFFSKPPKAKTAKVKTVAKGEYGEVFQMPGIIVNPIDTRGTNHLLIDIGFESTDSKVLAEIVLLEPQLRDNFITFLSAQRIDVLTDIKMRERIRDRIIEITNYHLTRGVVDKVYFIRYVYQ